MWLSTTFTSYTKAKCGFGEKEVKPVSPLWLMIYQCYCSAEALVPWGETARRSLHRFWCQSTLLLHPNTSSNPALSPLYRQMLRGANAIRNIPQQPMIAGGRLSAKSGKDVIWQAWVSDCLKYVLKAGMIYVFPNQSQLMLCPCNILCPQNMLMY